MPKISVPFEYTAEQLQRRLEIKRALLNHAEGFNSLTDWAKKRGFSPKTVQEAVLWHVLLKNAVHPPRPRKHGVTNLMVLSRLAVDTGIEDLFTTQQPEEKREMSKLKITDVQELTSHVITINDDGDEQVLLRYAPDNWQVRMGDSWEMDMFDKSEMAEFEELFVEWQKTSGQQ